MTDTPALAAPATTKASSKTTLKWGTIEVPIGLFKTTKDPAKEIKFEHGGPNGGRLVTRARPQTSEEQAAEAPAHEDPLALDPGPEPDRPPVEDAPARAGALPTVTSAPTGVPVLVEEGTEQIVEREEVRRGVWRTLASSDDGETSDEEFIDCTEQLKHIEKQTALEVMEIQGAIDATRVPSERVIGSYDVGTDGEGAPKVLELLCQGMAANRRALVVKWTKTRRQACGVLVARKRRGGTAGGGWSIMLLQLAWPEDWRKLPKRAEIPGGLCSPAEHEKASELIRAMADSSALLEEQRDDALAMREELFQLAETGRVEDFEMPPSEPEPELMDTLEASLEAQLAQV